VLERYSFSITFKGVFPGFAARQRRISERRYPRAGRRPGALKGCEIVFHLAAQSTVMGAVAVAGFSFSTNVVGTYNVLQSAAADG
jgi:nucleoside-diphosphate-sugar epimerase